MRSWSSPSAKPADLDTATIVARFVEASRRAEILALVNSAHTEGAVASAAVNEVSEAFEAEAAFVVVTRPGYVERETIGQIGLTAEQAAAVSANGLCGAALGSARAQVHSGDDLLGLGMRRVALAPWTAEHGRQVVVGVARRYDEPFDPPELALLEAVADAVGHGLERAWLGEERDRHAARQAGLARAARSLSVSLITGEVLQTLSREVSQAFEADAVVVCGSDDEGGMRVVAGAGLPAAALGRRSASGDLIACVRTAGEARVSQPFDGEAPVALPGLRALRSGLAAPIRPRRGVDGVVLVGYHADRWIERADVELLSAFADLAGIVQRNADDHAAAQRAASLDSLTGCLNHGAFQDRLREEITRAERSELALTLVLVDLNDFKATNDRFGHPIGDAVLRGVADALRSAVRVYDRVARYGGDEFALLLPAIDEAIARSVVDRALGALGEVKLPDGTAVSATAGLAHWRAGDQPSALIRRADQALLELKRARRRDRGAIPSGGDELAPAQEEQRECHRLRRLATAGALGAQLARLLDERAIAETAIIQLGAALGYDRCVLVRLGEGGALEVTSAESPQAGPAGSPVASARPTFEPTDAVRRCLHERRTVLARDGSGSELAVPVCAGAHVWGALMLRATQGVAFDYDDAQLIQSVAEHLGSALRTAQLYEQLDEAHLGTAAALAAALEARDYYTADHARSIAELAVAVGRELGMQEDALRDIRYGAIFHDIGKIAIPDAILNKAGPLTASEFEIIRQHPVAGERILAPVPFLSGVRRIVRHDHERWDGRGYPDGLRGEQIPLGARIVFVVDAYHAMRSNRPYRRALSPQATRAELHMHAGTQFDPRVVHVLVNVVERHQEELA